MNHANVDLKHSPVFNNFSLLIGKKPLSFPLWMNKGINVFKDLFDDDGLRAFSDLRAEYDLPGSSFFFYLQLRSAMKAYGVPWGIPLLTHPLQKLCAPPNQMRGLVSKLYKFISDPRTSLPVESLWDRDLTSMGEEDICWDTIWENLHDTSKNPDHQLIHFKFIHRLDLTPRKRICIGTVPVCLLSGKQSLSLSLSDLLEISVPLSPSLLLLNDDSTLELCLQQRHILWAGLTAAKRMLALRWQPPHNISWQQWADSFLDIVMLERSVARMHAASQKTINAWDAAYTLVKDRVQRNYT